MTSEIKELLEVRDLKDSPRLKAALIKFHQASIQYQDFCIKQQSCLIEQQQALSEVLEITCSLLEKEELQKAIEETTLDIPFTEAESNSGVPDFLSVVLESEATTLPTLIWSSKVKTLTTLQAKFAILPIYAFEGDKNLPFLLRKDLMKYLDFTVSNKMGIRVQNTVNKPNYKALFSNIYYREEGTSTDIRVLTVEDVYLVLKIFEDNPTITEWEKKRVSLFKESFDRLIEEAQS